MTNYPDCWLRLEQVIGWAEMSTNYFAYHIGLSRPDTIYRIKAGKLGISQNLARRIVNKFPEISQGWLLSGEGDMLGQKSGNGLIPYYDDGIAEGLSLLANGIEPTKYLHLPVIGDCDGAFRCYDEAMAEDVQPGTTVFLKQTDVNSIVPGGIYVVVCSNFVLLRRVHAEQSDGGRILVLAAANKNFDTVRIAQSDVKQLFKLMGTLRLY